MRGIRERNEETIIIKIASKDLVDNNLGLLSSSGLKVKIQENLFKEASILKSITNNALFKTCKIESIVEFIDFFNDSQNYFFIMSDGGQTLQPFVEKCHEYIFYGKLDIKQWINIVQNILKQIVYLMDIFYNKLKICHLDISLDNLLIKNVKIIQNENNKNKIEISGDFRVSLCDFESAEDFQWLMVINVINMLERPDMYHLNYL